MSAIRIRKLIGSETLHLPELVPFVGHTADIVIDDQSIAVAPMPAFVPGSGDWDAFRQALIALHDTYDYAAIADQDARDLVDAEDRTK